MLIATVVGNRPQFIKAAAVSRRLRERHREILIHTGQHHDPELSQLFFDELELPVPDRELGLGGSGNLEQIGRMLPALGAELKLIGPDAVLVYGDTNTTLAAALAAAHLQLPLIHVEAGMRSFDRTMPEETSRVLTDHLAGLCLCSTPLALENLAREGLAGVLIGDVMADLAVALAARARRESTVLRDHGLAPRSFVLATAHRPGNVDEPRRLERLVSLLAAIPMTVFFPVHPRTRARLEASGLARRLEAAGNIILHEPLGYLDLLALIVSARAVLTDSGGLQKEAYVLGTPCITLRDRTEWQETVAAGWNTLVDLDADAARAALRRNPPDEHPDLYCAGRAVENLLAAVGRWTPALPTGSRQPIATPI